MDLIVTFIQKKKKKNGSVMDTKVGGGVISSRENCLTFLMHIW
jgi:hypothetical protein